MSNRHSLKATRVIDIPAHSPVIRFGMARFCPTCDLIHQQQGCPKCDGQASIDLREMMTATRPALTLAAKPHFGIYRVAGSRTA
jgi:hypothetical protein